jgi:DNA-binding transcriptional MocR family regulator
VGYKTAHRLIEDGRLAQLKPAHALVALVLAHAENAKSGAFLSTRELARKAHVSHSTAVLALEALRDAGVIVAADSKPRGVTVWRFASVPIASTEGSTDCTDNAHSSVPIGGTDTDGDCTDSEYTSVPILRDDCTHSARVYRTGKENRESEPGRRAAARSPERSSRDVGLTPEEIAERNRLDLAFKRRKEAEVERERSDSLSWLDRDRA